MKLSFRKKGEGSHFGLRKKGNTNLDNYKDDSGNELLKTNLLNEKVMENFEKINFDTFLDYFEEASDNGTRVRMSDPKRWQQFHSENNIDRFIVDRANFKLRGCKMTIIEKGIGKGLYIYSWNMDNPDSNYCYKYK